MDLADGIYLQRWLQRAGPAPACEAALDVVADGSVDLADSFLLWAHAFSDAGSLPDLEADACAGSEAVAQLEECGRMTLEIVAPRKADGAFDATVSLTSHDLAVEGWQLSLTANGCRIASATLEGTRSADARDGGRRSMGYGRVDVVEGGVVSAVALSWLESSDLAASDDAAPILAVHVEATGEDCVKCQLTLEDGLTATGQPVRNTVVVEGRDFRPDLEGSNTKLCGD